MSQENEPPRNRLITMRFRLRTLLIFVALVQLPLISYVYVRSRVKRDAEAVDAILGDRPGQVSRAGKVLFNTNQNRWSPTRSPWQERAAARGVEPWLFGISAIEASHRNLNADATSRLADLRSLQSLRLRHSTFDASAAMPDASFPKLKAVDLRGSTLSEPLMAAIGRSHTLADLRLNECALPAESLSHLGDLKKLRILRLCKANIVQHDWSFLRGLDNLESLLAADVTGSAIPVYKLPPSLEGCGVARSALDFSGERKSFPNLRAIGVEQTNVALSDLLQLIANCPKLELVGIMKGDLKPEEVKAIKTAFPKLEVYELPYSNVVPVEVE